MGIGDFLKGLIIDRWYKVFVYLGALGLILSLFVDVKGVTNQELLILSLGFFFIGIGVWKNEKQESFIKSPNAYTGPAAFIQYTIRRPDFVGVFFEVVGALLFLFGLGHIVWAFFFQSW